MRTEHKEIIIEIENLKKLKSDQLPLILTTS